VRDYQSRGVGYRLKLAQRRFVIGRGQDLVKWTFDPLQAVNACFNIGKLGGVCRTYLRNLYGVLDDSLNRGRVTDRFEVEWWVRSRRVIRRLQSQQEPIALQDMMSIGVPVVNETRLRKHVRTASAARLGVRESRLLVEIPESIVKVREVGLDACREWTLNLRRVLEHYFARRYMVTDVIVEREDDERRVFYMLESNFRR
jgi:predicted GNAT superfamily acetyltransferase